MKDIHSEKVLILDFGSQYTMLIARRVREFNVYCEIHPFNYTLQQIKDFAPKGIILSGGPSSVYDKDSPISDKGLFDLGIPVLGICYGMQLIAYQLGGEIVKSDKREYGMAHLDWIEGDDIFADMMLDGAPMQPR
jgi:GMP synthase (glutamine-hydrolysing)